MPRVQVVWKATAYHCHGQQGRAVESGGARLNFYCGGGDSSKDVPLSWVSESGAGVFFRHFCEMTRRLFNVSPTHVACVIILI